MDGGSAYMQRRFGLLSQLFNRQYAVHVQHLIVVPADALEFLLDITPHGLGDLDMMAGDVELHSRLLSAASFGLTVGAGPRLLTSVSILLSCVRWRARCPLPRGTSRPCGARRVCLLRTGARRYDRRSVGLPRLPP